MAIITGIEERRGQVILRAEGMETARIPKRHFEKHPVKTGDDVDIEAWLDRIAAAQLAEGYEAALTALDYCERTAKELSDALRRKGYVPAVIEAVVDRLRASGLIDDARYAKRMAEIQSAKPVGVHAFRRKLKAKGISEEDAEAAIARFDDEQQRAACRATAQKLWPKYEALPSRESRAKLSQALARRGFGWDAIEAVIDEIID